MATVGQVYYNVIDYGTSNMPISSGVDIFDSTSTKGIVGQVPGASYFSKIGIQAPAGTLVVMDNKSIMIGASGMYELDDDIKVERLYFRRPLKYKRDDALSNAAIQKGAAEIEKAYNEKQASLATLNNKYGGGPPSNTDIEASKAYWTEFNLIQETFLKAYNVAVAEFNRGKNGIYVLPFDGGTSNPNNFDDLYNVIIDFIYE